MALLVHEDGHTETIEILSLPEHQQLQAIQNAVKGYIEIVAAQVPHSRYAYIVVNEEGRLNGMGVNKEAQSLAVMMAPHVFGHAPVVGPALFCSQDEVN